MMRSALALRTGDPADAPKLHALITANLEEGHLLPRTLGEVTVHANRFVVATRGKRIVGCAELAPLSARVAEVRSLAVARSERGHGVGTSLVEELRRRAERESYQTLCAFTHVPAYFTHMGFSIVPHPWIMAKVQTDCVRCPHFRSCGQYAMVLPLDQARAGRRVPFVAQAASRTLAVHPA